MALGIAVGNAVGGAVVFSILCLFVAKIDFTGHAFHVKLTIHEINKKMRHVKSMLHIPHIVYLILHYTQAMCNRI